VVKHRHGLRQRAGLLGSALSIGTDLGSELDLGSAVILGTDLGSELDIGSALCVSVAHERWMSRGTDLGSELDFWAAHQA
jgi:hypothetical protein